MSDTRSRRRWTGAVILGTSLLMLLLGELVLKSWFSPAVMLMWWLGCFALAAIAMIIAVAVASAVARRSLEARRELITKTVTEIETDLKSRSSQKENEKSPDKGA